jgi:SRP72 RNA-binding domain
LLEIVRMKYAKKLTKLKKLRDVDSFRALVQRLLKASESDPETLAHILKVASINSARLKLWSDCYSLSSQFLKASPDQQVIKVFGEAVYHNPGTSITDDEALLSSLLRSSGIEDSLDDVDLDELKSLKTIPSSLPLVVRKRERRHKPRYPKGFDPEKPGPVPDPERWLPKNQRTRQVKNSKTKSTGFQGGSAPAAAAGASTAQMEASKNQRRRR